MKQTQHYLNQAALIRTAVTARV